AVKSAAGRGNGILTLVPATMPQTTRPVATAPDSAAEPSWLFAGRIPCLDGWRAVAILMVLCVQAKGLLHDVPALHGLAGKCGFIGVQVFFVISGFLITTLLLREIDRTGRVSLKQFYYRRMLHILPAYGLYLAALLALQVLGLTSHPLDGREWAAVVTYTV